MLLYFDETQNVNVNVNLLISTRRLTHTELSSGFTLHFAFHQSKATDPIGAFFSIQTKTEGLYLISNA